MKEKNIIEKHIKIAEKILNKEYNDIFTVVYYYNNLCVEAIKFLKEKTRKRTLITLLKYLGFSPKDLSDYQYIISRFEKLNLEFPKCAEIESDIVPIFLDISDYQYKKILASGDIEPKYHKKVKGYYGKTWFCPVFDIFSIIKFYRSSLTDPEISLMKIKKEIEPLKIDIKKNKLKYSTNLFYLFGIELSLDFPELQLHEDYGEIKNKLSPYVIELNDQINKLNFKSFEKKVRQLLNTENEIYWNEWSERFSFNNNDGKLFRLDKKQKLGFEKALKLFELLNNTDIKAATNLKDLENEKINFDYMSEFPAMKNKERKFVFILGETNSGKTYEALEALKNSKTGVYLSPIRLLSYEKYQELTGHGLEVELKTGEETILNPLASHFCSTVELVDPNKKYEVGIIDEIQMIDDPERGRAWLNAILSLNAETIYVLGSHDFYSKQKLIAYLKQNHFDVEIKKKKRFSALIQLKEKVNALKLENRDVIVAFDKNTLFCLAAEMEYHGITCSVLFGDLTYQRKLSEIEKFKSGESQILIATDVIAMGINMPIKRILFYKTYKYNGSSNYSVSNSLFKQIIGRAGRYKEDGFYGIYQSNFVNGLMHNEDLKYLKNHNQSIFNDLSEKLGQAEFKEIELPMKENYFNEFNYGYNYHVLKKIYNTHPEWNILKIIRFYKETTPFNKKIKKGESKTTIQTPNTKILYEIISKVGVECLLKILSFNSSTTLFDSSDLDGWIFNINTRNIFIEERVAKMLKFKKALNKIERIKKEDNHYEYSWSNYAKDLSFTYRENYNFYNEDEWF